MPVNVLVVADATVVGWVVSFGAVPASYSSRLAAPAPAKSRAASLGSFAARSVNVNLKGD
jgi:hypothetical protein